MVFRLAGPLTFSAFYLTFIEFTCVFHSSFELFVYIFYTIFFFFVEKMYSIYKNTTLATR